MSLPELGGGTTLRHNGKTYTISPLTFELQGEFSDFLEQRAWETLERQKPRLSDEEYYKRWDRLDEKITAGVYAFGGPVCQDAVRTLVGAKELLRLSLKVKHPEVDHEFVDNIFEEKAREANAAIARANPDPLGEGPESGPARA